MWNAHKEDKERRRFVAEGLTQRPPVLAVAGFFLAMWLAGWVCSALLLALGMRSLPARYAISTLVSYGVFIGCVGFWCQHAANPRRANSNLGSPLDALDAPSDGEGCLIVLAIGFVAFLFSGLFWLVGGYALLFEVAFEVAFAGTMVYRMNKRYTLGNWAGTLLLRTWLPALVVIAILAAAGAKMQHDYPEALTMSQAIKAHRSQQK